MENASTSALVVVAAGNYADDQQKQQHRTPVRPILLAIRKPSPLVRSTKAYLHLEIKNNSRRGDWVHLAAPGENIKTSHPNSIQEAPIRMATTPPSPPPMSQGQRRCCGRIRPRWSSNTIRSRLLLTAHHPNPGNPFLSSMACSTPLPFSVPMTREPLIRALGMGGGYS